MSMISDRPGEVVKLDLSAGRLAEIAAREQAATRGPWQTDSWEIYGPDGWIGETLHLPAGDSQSIANAEFMAKAREDVPALLAEVARLTARVARLENSEAAGQRVIARMSREARALEDELVRRQRRIADLADRTETAETHIAEYQALELGDLDGRVSASCPNPSHPTWLREADDIRACPWCRIAELEREATIAARAEQAGGQR